MSTPYPRQNAREVNKRFFKPLRRLIKMNYFRFKVRGANHIPSEGQVIFVANHSGWVAIDALFLMMAIHDTAGPEYLPYIIVHDMITRVPLVSDLLKSIGMIPADWLHYGREPLPPELNPIAIFPEGADGNSKPFWKAYHMQPWKSGFVRLAIQRKALVVPVVITGGEESVPVARTLDAFKPLLGSVAPLPVSLMPLPSSWKVQFLEPLDFSAYDPALLHSREDCKRIAAEVHDLVQHELEKAARRRPLLWLSNLVEQAEQLTHTEPVDEGAEPIISAEPLAESAPQPVSAPDSVPEPDPLPVRAAPPVLAAGRDFDISSDDNVD